jgi:chaperonin GroES
VITTTRGETGEHPALPWEQIPSASQARQAASSLPDGLPSQRRRLQEPNPAQPYIATIQPGGTLSRLDSIRVIGDRVLILPDAGQQRTHAGLYLPPTVTDRDTVQGGVIVAVGPGTPLPDPEGGEGEPWKPDRRALRHLPMEVEVGDFALFLRKAAIEIKLRETRYVILPLAGLLLVERGGGGFDLDRLIEEAERG